MKKLLAVMFFAVMVGLILTLVGLTTSRTTSDAHASLAYHSVANTGTPRH